MIIVGSKLGGAVSPMLFSWLISIYQCEYPPSPLLWQPPDWVFCGSGQSVIILTPRKFNLGCAIGAVIVYDDMKRRVAGELPVDTAQEFQELLA